MKNTNYHLHLKGYVGGCDFDRNYVDYTCERADRQPRRVAGDSTFDRQRLPCAWRCHRALRGNERERRNHRLARCQAYLHGLLGNVPGAQMQRGVL